MRFFLILSLGIFSSSLFAEQWQLNSSTKNIKIFNRDKDNSSVKEIKAIKTINIPFWVLMNVIVDKNDRVSEYMPYLKKSKIIRRNKKYKWAYQRLDIPLISDRDYTIKQTEHIEINPISGKLVFTQTWVTDNANGPDSTDDAVRIEENNGYWLLKEIDPTHTKVVYYIHSDPKGSIPSFLIDSANIKGIPAIFASVEKQANLSENKESKAEILVNFEKKNNSKTALNTNY